MITRFAPSPTGRLHLGHAYSAYIIATEAKRLGAKILLRIEDTDSTRCRSEFIDAILEDLKWSGLLWTGPIRYQSKHAADYAAVVNDLAKLGLLYPCSCTRRQIANAGAVTGWDGLVYPGTCRNRSMDDARPGDALRLNINKSFHHIDSNCFFEETGPLHTGRHDVHQEDVVRNIGDPVLRRKDTGDPSYHLACTHDDMLQGITHIIRGDDLFRQTWLHVVIQKLMGWPTPIYHHHALVRDEDGVRLAKIANSQTIQSYRESGATIENLRNLFEETIR